MATLSNIIAAQGAATLAVTALTGSTTDLNTTLTGTDFALLSANTFTGAQTVPASGIILTGSSTGKTTFTSANSSASDYTITFPAATATVATLSDNTFTGQQTFKETADTVYTITDGAAFEIDPGNGNIQIVTLGASRTPAATNFAAGQCVLLGIDDGTAYSITWTTVAPTWVKAGGTASAPTLATSGYTWILLWKVATTIYAAEVGKP